MSRVTTLVFDLDGTLVDSRQDLANSINAMLSRMGLPPHEPQVIYGFIGEGAERLIRRSLGPAQEARYAEAAPIWREEYAKRLLDHTRLYAGIAQALRDVPAVRAVLTNKPGGFARRILKGVGVLDAFKVVVGGDEVPKKPAPDGLLKILKDLGATPSEAILVGDSPIDLATGRAAGVRVCAVDWGLGERAALAGADYLCSDAQQLSNLLRQLVSS